LLTATTASHSFGCEIRRRSNLHIIEEDVLMCIAGNLVQIVNLQTFEHTYLRSTSGGGIGALVVRFSTSAAVHV